MALNSQSYGQKKKHPKKQQQQLIAHPKKALNKSLRESIDLVSDRRGLSNSLVVPAGLLQKKLKFKNYKSINIANRTALDSTMEIYSKDAVSSYQVFSRSPD